MWLCRDHHRAAAAARIIVLPRAAAPPVADAAPRSPAATDSEAQSSAGPLHGTQAQLSTTGSGPTPRVQVVASEHAGGPGEPHPPKPCSSGGGPSTTAQPGSNSAEGARGFQAVNDASAHAARTNDRPKPVKGRDATAGAGGCGCCSIQ